MITRTTSKARSATFGDFACSANHDHDSEVLANSDGHTVIRGFLSARFAGLRQPRSIHGRQGSSLGEVRRSQPITTITQPAKLCVGHIRTSFGQSRSLHSQRGSAPETLGRLGRITINSTTVRKARSGKIRKRSWRTIIISKHTASMAESLDRWSVHIYTRNADAQPKYTSKGGKKYTGSPLGRCHRHMNTPKHARPIKTKQKKRLRVRDNALLTRQPQWRITRSIP